MAEMLHDVMVTAGHVIQTTDVLVVPPHEYHFAI